jgi:hypothetical protein
VKSLAFVAGGGRSVGKIAVKKVVETFELHAFNFQP